jgi:hypothetical protein
MRRPIGRWSVLQIALGATWVVFVILDPGGSWYWVGIVAWVLWLMLGINVMIRQRNTPRPKTKAEIREEAEFQERLRRATG